MKRLIAIPAIFLTVLLALIAGPSFIDWNQYKPQARTQVETLSGLMVEINGDLSLALLPTPRVYIQDVTVKNPATGADNVLAALKMLDVRVAFFPLLSGEIVVNSVHLDSPQIRLLKDSSGRLNYMTPQIEALMAVPAQQDQKPQTAISFQNISIENGAFHYKDVAAKAPIEAKNINIDLSADTLEGPFDLKGSLLFGARDVEFSAKTGKLDKTIQSTSLNLKASLGGTDISYAGVVTLGQAPEVQGEIELVIAALEQLAAKSGAAPSSALRGRVEVKGVLSANAEQVSLKNAAISLAGQNLEGAIDVKMNPFSLHGDFVAEEALNLDKLLVGTNAKLDKPQNSAGIGIALPESLTLPVMGPVNLNFSLPALVYNKNLLKDVTLALTKAGHGFALDVSAAEIPGKGAVKGRAALEFSEKTTKDGSEILTKPKASFSLKGKMQNTPEAIKAFTGLTDLPLVKDSRVSVFDVSGQFGSSALIIENGVINLDEKAFSVSGSYKVQKDTSRPLLTLNILADALDFDALAGGSGQASNADPLAGLKSLALPYDLIFDATVNNAVAQGHQVQGLKAAFALTPNTLKIKDVGAQNFAGSSLKLEGDIADLKNLGGLDLGVLINSPDPYKLAESLKIDSSAWPKNLGAVKVNAKAKGAIASLDSSAAISALAGEVIFKGAITNPLTAPALSGVALQVKHPNMAAALKNFGASAPDYKSFSGPIDLFTTVDMNGKITSLGGIKGIVAGADVSGDLKYDASASVPALSGQLTFGRLVLQSAKGAAAQGGSSREVRPTAGAGGKWSTLPIDSGFLHSINANLAINANSILYETWDMQSPSLRIMLQNGTLSIADLKAGLFDGNISLKGQVSSAAKDKPLNVDIDSKITGVNMGALAKVLSGSGRIQAEGNVSLDFNVSGQGLSQNEIVNSLSGQANLNGRNVVMKGFDMAGLATALMDSSKPLDRLQQILGASTSGGSTSFDTVEGVYTINSGIVNIDRMQMDGPAATIVSKGNASFPRWFIDTQHLVTLKQAQKIQPFNVTIKGPLDNPTNTFGKGMFDTIMREKVQDKVIEKLPGLLGDDATSKLQKFGILPPKQAPQPTPIDPAPLDAAPASGGAVLPSEPVSAEPAPTTPPLSEEEQAEEAIKGLLNNLLQ